MTYAVDLNGTIFVAQIANLRHYLAAKPEQFAKLFYELRNSYEI